MRCNHPRIADPDAVKPEDWDESQPAEVPDESAEKPDGWLDDEESLIPDPDSQKPDDWDEEMDGEWEAPLIGEEPASVHALKFIFGCTVSFSNRLLQCIC